MRLVLDANVLLSATMRDSFTRALLVHPRVELVMPEYALDEVARHLPTLARRMDTPIDQARLTLDLLLDNVETVPHEEYAAHMARAEGVLRDLDPDDAPFAALAFATGCPIWTRDKALLESQVIPTVSTEELAARLGGP